MRNAFTPMIWLAALLTPGLLYFGHAEAGFAKGFLFALAGIVVIAAIVAYFYLAFRHPARLQSEDWQLRHEGLDLVRTKSGKIRVDSDDIARIAIERPRELESGDK